MSKITVSDSYPYGGYNLYWVIDGDIGGAIGECKPTTADDAELRAAYEAAKPFADSHPRGAGFFFETESKAKKAATAVRAAFKALAAERAGRPWPEWAKTAKAAGWNPPKGWTP